jgi:hypothetical protein
MFMVFLQRNYSAIDASLLTEPTITDFQCLDTMTTKQPEKRWTFGSIVVYAPNLPRARQAYELIRKNASSEAFGTVTLEDGTQIRWVDLSRKSNN